MNNIKLGTKRALLMLACLFLFTVNGFTKPRNTNEALSVAQSFIQEPGNPLLRSISGKKTLSLAYSCTQTAQTRSTPANSYYYIFNIGDNDGFVIVSGDDRAKSILGYSDEGSFSQTDIPVNFRNWLAMYKQEMIALFATPDTSDNSKSVGLTVPSPSYDTKLYANYINPLLGDIKWNQSYPYNIFCPIVDSTTTPTGCVATAMAQIMKYYEWPVTGYGKYGYKQAGIMDSLKANFGNTTYDWAHMNNTYSYDATPSINDTAVATLMYHCGIAVNMKYNPDGSAAYSNDVPDALSKYFGYDANCQILNRDYYTAEEWENKIKQELNLSRPVIYGGADIEGSGHQFVCDGYDTNDLFHFNWGWSGHYNGYFELSSLNVETPGIGGGSGGYSIGQDIIVGIQKPNGSSVKSYEIVMPGNPFTDTTTIARQGKFNFNYGFANIGGNTFSGEFAIALYQDNTLITPLILYRSVVLPSYYGNANAIAEALSIPTGVTSGFYKIYAVYRGTGDTEWKMIRSKVGTNNYLTAFVGTNTITFSVPDVFPILTLTDSIQSVGRIYKGKTGRFAATIENNGGEYNSYILFAAKSVATNTVTYLAYEPVNIPTATTKTIELSCETPVDPGQYLLQVYYDKNNDQDNAMLTLLGPSLMNSVPIAILNEPSSAPIITLQEKISVSDSTVANGSDLILRTKIKNSGGFFNNYIAAFIFSDTARMSVDYLGPVMVVLDSTEEKTLSMNKPITLSDGKYNIQVFSYNDSTSRWVALTPLQLNSVSFNVVTTTRANEISNQPQIFPNPAKDLIQIQSPTRVNSYTIMDLTGKTILKQEPNTSGIISICIDQLSSGLYLIQTDTDSGTFVTKFYKL